MHVPSFCSIGDCVVDKYTDHGFATLGGTAFYSALTASSLNAKTSIVSAVGNDNFAKKYQEVLSDKAIDATHLREVDLQTSSITITLDKDGKPNFSEWDLGVLRNLDLTPKDQQFIANHDIARVALFKSFEHVFEQMHQMKLRNTLKVADFSGGSMYSNEKEILERYIEGFDIIAKSITEDELLDLSYYETLAKRREKIIILTAGRKGSVCFTKDLRFDEPVKEITDTNTTGSGDVYLTTFSIVYKKSLNISLAMERATEQVRQFLKNQLFRYKVSL
jgi:sugar/nucleoside kinase (ribokinase family)